jgi:hypothetical protein
MDFASASAIFQLNFAIVPTLWYFFVFHLINLYSKLHRRQITRGGATFNNISAISWRPVLVVEEAGVPGENYRPWASNW